MTTVPWGAWWISAIAFAKTLRPHRFQHFADSVNGHSDNFTGLDACAGSQAPVTDFDAFIDIHASVIDPYISDGDRFHERDLKDIVDGLLNTPPRSSLGIFPTN